MANATAKILAGVKVALVFPTFTDVELASYADNARFLGSVPPLSLAYVAAELKKYGAQVLLLDCPTLGLHIEDAIERTRLFDPDYIGFTLATVDWSSSLHWMQKFKAALNKRILVGGIHMECYPAETLSHPCIDLGFVGYADRGLAPLLAADLAGNSLKTLPGAVYRRPDGSVQVNTPGPFERNADKMGLPARELLPVEKHFSIVSTRRNFTAAMSNFGCPFGCEFCILANNKVRWRSAKHVVDEMEACYYDFGITEIDYFDPIFSIRKDRLLAICDEIRRRGLHKKVIWSVRARTDAIDDTCLDAMWKAGCRRIFYGIESGSEAILHRVDKHQKSIENMARTIRRTKARGYEVLAFVMIGNPLESPQTVAQTKAMLLDMPIDLIQVASLFPLPKTPIYNAIMAETGVDFWREHILHGTPVKPFPLLETDLTSDEIEKMVTKLYISFYFRPTFARFALSRLRYPTAVRRGMAAAWGISSHFMKDALPFGRA